MKISRTNTLALSLASLISIPTLAEENTAKNAGLYLGVKAGKIQIDAEGFDDASSKGLLAGYRFGNNISVELEYNKAEPEYSNPALSSLAGKLDYDTKAAYVAYRSSGNLYFKARGGYLRETLNDNRGTSKNDNGLSIGGGAGVRLSSLAVEAEYTILGEDTNLISVNLILNF